jgi:hypothetical protein
MLVWPVVATWYIQIESDGQRNVLFKSRDLFESAGRCSAATPIRTIIEWIVNEADAADVIVTHEGAFALPFRTPTQWEVRC